MELNAEQIKKALECCQFRHIKKNCDECKYHRWIEPACRDLICQDALTLINSQEQKIKELTEEFEKIKNVKYIFSTVDYCSDDLANALKENKRLIEENESLRSSVDQIAEELEARHAPDRNI